ncbi:hypothetical protein BpHYR1_036360 [Brachionus plicatilis]|uniref:Uncharacterized protein n=1 Tax=Brachionus plicatilis TaxID=10195 RepID=A0A3M7P5R7_BRAPC|nr:hypothetical protein BpHYR1_036360 [Brachionus plicatilis]
MMKGLLDKEFFPILFIKSCQFWFQNSLRARQGHLNLFFDLMTSFSMVQMKLNIQLIYMFELESDHLTYHVVN